VIIVEKQRLAVQESSHVPDAEMLAWIAFTATESA
jgi:hypothetical protein